MAAARTPHTRHAPACTGKKLHPMWPQQTSVTVMHAALTASSRSRAGQVAHAALTWAAGMRAGRAPVRAGEAGVVPTICTHHACTTHVITTMHSTCGHKHAQHMCPQAEEQCSADIITGWGACCLAALLLRTSVPGACTSALQAEAHPLSLCQQYTA